MLNRYNEMQSCFQFKLKWYFECVKRLIKISALLKKNVHFSINVKEQLPSAEMIIP